MKPSAKPALSARQAAPERHGPGQCQVANDVISLVGDKWSVLVVSTLGGGTMRFSELKRAVEGISQKMLTTTLRGLERDGYLTRTVYPTVPPRVDYELTPLGQELLEPVAALGNWAVANHARVLAARRAYDSREGQPAGRETGHPAQAC